MTPELERVIFWTEDGSGVQILSHPELTSRAVAARCRPL